MAQVTNRPYRKKYTVLVAIAQVASRFYEGMTNRIAYGINFSGGVS